MVLRPPGPRPPRRRGTRSTRPAGLRLPGHPDRPGRRLGRPLSALLLSLGLLGSGAAPALARGGDRPAPGRYVALGDSYTAGPLIPLTHPGVPGCGRSTRNYPRRVAAALGVGSFTDASCGEATTAEMTAPQRTDLGVNPPQLDALTADTTLVTVGIGGNDIGFGEIAQRCFNPLPLPLGRLGRPCRQGYTATGADEISVRIALAAPLVGAVLAEIDRRAPGARVLVVGYPALLPAEGPGCWPLLPMLGEDVSYLRDKTVELNAMLADQAASHGATYVDLYSSSVGHDACQLPLVKWVEGYVPTALAAPLHPNARGMRHAALRVLAVLGEPAARASQTAAAEPAGQAAE